MKKKLRYIFLLPLLSLIACSGEDDSVTDEQQFPSLLELHVRAGDFVPDSASDTRATDNGAVTIFENGDRVGITILDGNNNVLANNVPYKYNGNTWSFDSYNGEDKSQCYYDKKAVTYIVYFPYSKAANGVTTIEELKKVFPPQVDQHTQDAYRASDLMIWSSAEGPKESLNVELTHAYASVSFSPPIKTLLDDGNNTECISPSLRISSVSLTVGNELGSLPYYASDGSYRYILPEGFTGSEIRCFYTVRDKVYNNTVTISTSVTPNTRYTFTSEIRTYSLGDARTGDFYCKRGSDDNGYLIPGDVSQEDFIKLLGGNSCVGIVYRVGESIVNSTTYDHGCVIALKDLVIGNTRKFSWYEALAGYYSVAAPSKSSDWYLPNSDECSKILLEKIMLEKQLGYVTALGAENFRVDGFSSFWSSSEVNYFACMMDIDNGLIEEYDKSENFKVRYVLAF